MGRYFIGISYNGANYSGWQSQSNAVSIQRTVQDAFCKVLRQPIEIVGSSRTDAGVHALHTIAQFDGELTESIPQTLYKVNMVLPADISLLEIFAVKPDAKARYDAISRSYRYVIARKKDPFWVGKSMFLYGLLDVEKMQACCDLILKTSDFQALSKVNTQVNHFECKIYRARWREEESRLLFEITANRFLRGMVRALVGTLLEVGKGRISVGDFQKILESKDRKKAGENVPAYGLFLTNVEYPEGLKI